MSQNPATLLILDDTHDVGRVSDELLTRNPSLRVEIAYPEFSQTWSDGTQTRFAYCWRCLGRGTIQYCDGTSALVHLACEYHEDL